MFEFLFKYSPEFFADSEFLFASGWSLNLLIICSVGILLFLTAYLLWRPGRLRRYQSASLALLQGLMLAVLFFMVWQPALLSERLVQGENTVAVMLDTSASMALNEGGSSRMDQAQTLLTEDALNELDSLFQVLPYTFDAEARSVDAFLPLPDPGEESNLGASVLQTLRQASDASLGAVIVISDGADNSGNIPQAQLNEIAAYGVPVHTVGIGRSEIPEDLELMEVVLPEKALPGTTLSARLAIRHDQAGTARIKVYNGDRFLSTKEVALNPDESMTLAYVDIEVAEPGQLDLRFSLDPLAGEKHLRNNEKSRVVDVPEDRYRILYVEGEPRWEYKFMRRALDEDPSIQLTTLLRVTPNKYYRQGINGPEELENGFPSESAELFNYDALIVGSMDVAEFSEAQLQLIRDFVSERGGSLLMLAGLKGLGLGGWGESPISEVLPSRLTQGENGFIREKVPVLLTDKGKTAPMLRFSESEAENLSLWAELPEVADYQHIGPLRPAASTLIDVEVAGRRQPLLVTQPYGRGHSYLLATGGTWRWQMSLPVEDKRHETFWRQLSRSLVANSPRPFELSTTVVDDEILVRADLHSQSQEDLSHLAVSAIISTDNEALTLDLLPVPNQAGSFEATFRPRQADLFAIEAISRIGDEPLSSARTAIRYDQGLEDYAIRQNRPLLERLADSSGGRYWTPAEWAELTEAVAYSSAGITEQELRFLWDAPVFFFLLFLLKGGEWLLRRRWNSI